MKKMLTGVVCSLITLHAFAKEYETEGHYQEERYSPVKWVDPDYLKGMPEAEHKPVKLFERRHSDNPHTLYNNSVEASDFIHPETSTQSRLALLEALEQIPERTHDWLLPLADNLVTETATPASIIPLFQYLGSMSEAKAYGLVTDAQLLMPYTMPVIGKLAILRALNDIPVHDRGFYIAQVNLVSEKLTTGAAHAHLLTTLSSFTRPQLESAMARGRSLLTPQMNGVERSYILKAVTLFDDAEWAHVRHHATPLLTPKTTALNKLIILGVIADTAPSQRASIAQSAQMFVGLPASGKAVTKHLLTTHNLSTAFRDLLGIHDKSELWQVERSLRS